MSSGCASATTLAEIMRVIRAEIPKGKRVVEVSGATPE